MVWKTPIDESPPDGEDVLMAYSVRRGPNVYRYWVYVIGCRQGEYWIDDDGDEDQPPDYCARIELLEVETI